MAYLGLDVGFGDVKAVFGPDQKLKFPTAVCYSKNGLGDMDDLTDSRTEYCFGGKKYLAGKHALYGALSTRSMDFLKRYIPLFAWKAVRESGSDAGRIAIGLPIAYYTKKNSLALTAALTSVEVNNEPLEFDVRVYPQGMGVLADFRLGFDGTEIPGTDINGLVLDVGFNTVDVLVFENGSAIKADMGMMERGGVSQIVQELSRALQVKTTINLSEQEAKEALIKGSLKVYGREERVSDFAGSIVEEYVEGLLDAIASRWEERIKRADKLILAGGGAYYLKDYLPRRYLDLIHIPKEPEFANARGFYKILRASR